MSPLSNPQLTASAPVLLVKNLMASVKHYGDTMGFTVDLTNGEPPHFAIIRRDGLRLMLQQAAKIDYPLGNKPYGCREFGTCALDDHDLAFGQIIEP